MMWISIKQVFDIYWALNVGHWYQMKHSVVNNSPKGVILILTVTPKKVLHTITSLQQNFLWSGATHTQFFLS